MQALPAQLQGENTRGVGVGVVVWGGGRVEVGAFVGGHGAYVNGRLVNRAVLLPRRAGNPGKRVCGARAA